MTAPRLEERFIHLGLGAKAEVLPPFTGMAWYEDYGARAAADGAEGRLVSQYTFSESWTSWEMHPAGAEVVICVAGSMVLVQELRWSRLLGQVGGEVKLIPDVIMPPV